MLELCEGVYEDYWLARGISWESSAIYYWLINEGFAAQQGDLHSAQNLLFSFDFDEIEHLQRCGLPLTATQRMIKAAQQLERDGTALLVICTNTMHRMAAALQQQIHTPRISRFTMSTRL